MLRTNRSNSSKGSTDKETLQTCLQNHNFNEMLVSNLNNELLFK